MIEGGFYIKARKIMNSEIMKKPPAVRELWDHLIMKAQHADFISLKRGQLYTSIPEIREDLSWFIGYRKETYSEKQMRGAMKVLTEGGMITKRKATHGMLVTICNYELYQGVKNYEKARKKRAKVAAKGARREEEGRNINKNVKELTPLTPNTGELELKPSVFRVDVYLTDQARDEARREAPGWDLQYLMRIYDEGINSGKRESPRKPCAAFPMWCASYTKGKTP